MKVFISWSGETSLKVAQIFREWLPSVMQSIEPYVSSEDIDKGARWSTDIAKELEDSTFGILCVTKDNLEAPWLSFEAGALSKTMEKAFVNPFLFDIKRSEVQGPILQFQSTIFEKEDIRRMVRTLNKASGEASITEVRLDKSFDVWYPTLEAELNKLKNESTEKRDGAKVKRNSVESEILEEILELSRDNQRLLRTPDEKTYAEIERIKEILDAISSKDEIYREQKRRQRKYSTVLLEEIVHMNSGKSSYGFLMTLSLVKEDFPWIYDMGKELVEIFDNSKSIEQKTMAIRDFRQMIDFTFEHFAMREFVGKNKDSIMFIKELPYVLTRYLDELSTRYLG